MANSIQVTIAGTTEQQTEILIALLSEAGYEGFEEADQGLIAYMPEESWNEDSLKETLLPFGLSYSTSVIQPRNWNAEWERDYEPVIVDDFVAVRAHFHQPNPAVVHEIIITPKMSFGTGHHATTWQMMKWMESMDFQSKTVFDFGTGTGVLAILAEKLGAAEVLAIDNDDWSIENTIENVERNNGQKISVQKAEEPIGDRQFDIILANINRHVLLQFMEQMSKQLKPGGYLLISGFYADENDILTDAAALHQLQLLKGSERHKWSSLMLQKNQ